MSKLNFAGLAVDPNELAFGLVQVLINIDYDLYVKEMNLVTASNRYTLDHEYALKQGEVKDG